MEKKFVLIEWLDSKGCTSGWEFFEDIKPQLPSNCITVGIIINDCKEYIEVAQSMDVDKDDEQVMGRMAIPRCSIKKVKRLR